MNDEGGQGRTSVAMEDIVKQMVHDFQVVCQFSNFNISSLWCYNRSLISKICARAPTFFTDNHKSWRTGTTLDFSQWFHMRKEGFPRQDRNRQCDIGAVSKCQNEIAIQTVAKRSSSQKNNGLWVMSRTPMSVLGWITRQQASRQYWKTRAAVW